MFLVVGVFLDVLLVFDVFLVVGVFLWLLECFWFLMLVIVVFVDVFSTSFVRWPCYG